MAVEVVGYLIQVSTMAIVDCTVGTGGHSEAMLQAASPQCTLLGIDLDQEALDVASARLSGFGDRVRLEKMNFGNLGTGLPSSLIGRVDALLIDCGISRLQVVRPNRGFSFDREGVLDMRFDRSGPVSAASLLGKVGLAELTELLKQFGEKSRSRRIAQAVIRMRDRGHLSTTTDLARAVKSVVPARAAKSLARVFLAVRCRVNQELNNLADALEAMPEVLSSGGRAAVIAYHSAEDRVVKQYFRKFSGRCICPPGQEVCTCGKAAWFRVLTPKPVTPSAEEIRLNPSARSARIRVVEKM
jgi:16S rRNA (cytosine1402-N4)-methyltransferase